jgi:hypothetical protein
MHAPMHAETGIRDCSAPELGISLVAPKSAAALRSAERPSSKPASKIRTLQSELNKIKGVRIPPRERRSSL